MALWKLTLAYDGTGFHGWQIQPGLATVQGTLASALHRITGEAVLPQGSGRTDAGVHALAQVASFALLAPIPAANLHRALNRTLPASIRVLSAATVDPPFHARHSARSKTYEYRIFLRQPLSIDNGATAADAAPEQICSPMLAPFVWDCPLRLCLDLLNRGAGHILGLHDFTTFAAAGPAPTPHQPADPLPDYTSTPPTNCRTVTHSLWTAVPAQHLLTYRITGSGFLHHMVRNLVGTFVEAGAGRLDPEEIPALLAAKDRSAAGPTAPARGLFLVEVQY